MLYGVSQQQIRYFFVVVAQTPGQQIGMRHTSMHNKH